MKSLHGRKVTPQSHQLTNQGREVSEVVGTRRLVKFPVHWLPRKLFVRVQDARIERLGLCAQGYSQMEIFHIVAVTYGNSNCFTLTRYFWTLFGLVSSFFSKSSLQSVKWHIDVDSDRKLGESQVKFNFIWIQYKRPWIEQDPYNNSICYNFIIRELWTLHAISKWSLLPLRYEIFLTKDLTNYIGNWFAMKWVNFYIYDVTCNLMNKRCLR